MSNVAMERPPAVAGSEARFRRVLSGSMVGAVLEWYDFVVYGMLAATVFAGQFFPKEDARVGLMLAFGTQAVGFAARPLGGIAFGHLGDKIGRKPTLIVTYIVLGLATASIGFLPNYAAIGVAAPLLLLLLRFIQGFAIGGEFGAAITLVSEHSNRRNRGFWVSLPQTGGPAGTLLATLVIAVISANVSPEAFQSWGWRIAFLIAIPMLVAGAWLRRNVEESPIYQEAVEDAEAKGGSIPASERGVRAALKDPVPLLQGLGVRIGENVGFYIYNIFVIAYAAKVLKFPLPSVLTVVTVGAAVQLLMMLFGGWLSDRVGRKPVMLAAAAGLAIWAPIFFSLAQTKELPMLYLAVCVGAGIHGLLAGPEAAWIAELFPTKHRMAGASLASQGSSVLGGGPAPLIATALLGASGQTTGVVIYLVLMAAISFFSVLSGPETKGIDLESVK
ncbi:MAG: MFS transporter [Nostocoides sp.]